MRRPVHVLLYEGCIFKELACATELLGGHFDVRYFTPDGRPLRLANGLQVVADGSFVALAAAAPAAVLVPGGDPGSIIEPDLAGAALREAHAGGALMAGICAGGLVLAHAGLLRGRRATHNYTPEWASAQAVACTAPIWQGIIYERADVVVDAPFVTAQPWADAAFAAAVGELLGVLTPEAAARVRDYARRTLAPR